MVASSGVGVLGLLYLLLSPGGFGLTLGIPPAAEDPVLAKIAPEKCLVYVAWNGMAKPDPKSSNQTEQLLAEPEVQKFASGIAKAVFGKLRAEARGQGPDKEQLVEDAQYLIRAVVTHPAALYLTHFVPGASPRPIRGGLVINLGDQVGKVRALLEKYQAKLPKSMLQPVDREGVSGFRLDDGKGPVVTWGTREQYLGIALGEGEAEAIIKRAENDIPPWLAQAIAKTDVPRRGSLVYVNVKALIELITSAMPGGRQPHVDKLLGAIGVGNLQWLAQISGLDKEGYLSRTHLALDGEPTGLLGLLPKQPLRAKDMALIPADSHVAAAAHANFEDTFDRILAIIRVADPSKAPEIDRNIEMAQQQLGFKIREDLLKSLGDTLVLYSSPGEGGMFPFALTAVVTVKDPAKLRPTFQKLMALARQAQEQGQAKPNRATIQRADVNGKEVFYLQFTGSPIPITPAWVLTDSYLAGSLSLQSLKGLLTRASDAKSLAGVPEVARLLGSKEAPSKFAYQNTPELFKQFYPMAQLVLGPISQQLRRQGIDFDAAMLPPTASIAPHLRPSITAASRVPGGVDVESRGSVPNLNVVGAAPVLAGLLLPAVNAARESARRASSMNNMRQLLLAMHMYENTHRSLPPACTMSKEGKPLLSWRVELLPYLGQESLHKQFKLDEPWDSPANKKLIERMPPILRSPRANPGPGKTCYLAVRGDKYAFPGAKKIGMPDLRDGMSNTILLVEVNDQAGVIWTRPDDFQPDSKQPTKGLERTYHPAHFLAGFADGHTQTIPLTIKPEMLKALFTRDGGEVINLDELR